jgi:hypothetical protein
VFGGFLVLALIVAAVSNYYFQTFTPVLVLTVLWIPAYVVLGYRFTYWRCPLGAARPATARFPARSDITRGCSAMPASTAGCARIRTADAQKSPDPLPNASEELGENATPE